MTLLLKYIAVFIAFMLCPLGAVAQSTLDFMPAEWDFGTIAEADGRVSYTFTGVNRSQKPLVILDVISSCGCTVPEFSRQPILPGGQVEIRVTFDPANRPGSFDKKLVVYDSERRKVATLTVRGGVVARPRSMEERYPVAAGDGLRLTETLVAFSQVPQVRSTVSAVGVANTSDKAIRLEVRSLGEARFVTMEYPRELSAGEEGEIRMTCQVPEGVHYGTLVESAVISINGAESRIRLVIQAVVVDNPELSNEISASKVEVDKYMLKFGLPNRTAGLQKLPLRITNRGDGELIVRAAEVSGGFGTTLRVGQTVLPERSVTAYVTLDPAQQEYGPMTGVLLLVTNDPSTPVRRIRLTAVIVE